MSVGRLKDGVDDSGLKIQQYGARNVVCVVSLGRLKGKSVTKLGNKHSFRILNPKKQKATYDSLIYTLYTSVLSDGVRGINIYFLIEKINIFGHLLCTFTISIMPRRDIKRL